MVNIRLKILDKGRIVEEQLLRVLQKHEDAIINGGTEDTTINQKITALETAIGKATGEDAGGIAKDVADAQTDITALETTIGDEDTEGSIIARIKALEDANNSP